MYSDISSIVRQLVRKIFRSSFTKTLDTREKLNALLEATRNPTFYVDYKKDLCSLDKVDVGIELKLLLDKLVKDDPSREKYVLAFRKDVQSIILLILSKISEKSPLKYDLVYNSSCIVPSNILKFSAETTLEKFAEVLTAICSANVMKHSDGDLAKGEMQTLIEKAKDIWKDQFKDFNDNSDQLDSFYFNLLPVDEFPKLLEVLEIIFVLSHGNAAVEGGFSVNKSLLIENLSEKSLVAQRTVIDGMKSAGGFTEVEIDTNMRKNFTLAHDRYKNYLKTNKEPDELKVKQAEQKKHEQISKLEKEIVDLDNKHDQEKAELVAKKTKMLVFIIQYLFRVLY